MTEERGPQTLHQAHQHLIKRKKKSIVMNKDCASRANLMNKDNLNGFGKNASDLTSCKRTPGHVTLVAITGNTKLILYRLVKSLQLI